MQTAFTDFQNSKQSEWIAIMALSGIKIKDGYFIVNKIAIFNFIVNKIAIFKIFDFINPYCRNSSLPLKSMIA